MTQYSRVIIRPPDRTYSSAARTTSSSGKRRLMGMRLSRSLSVTAWRESERLIWRSRAASFLNESAKPAVETVRRLAAIPSPSGAFMIRRAFSTLGQLSRGSAHEHSS
jgi:hypothetical protein